jgi:hypothetical protein
MASTPWKTGLRNRQTIIVTVLLPPAFKPHFGIHFNPLPDDGHPS